MLFTSFDKQKLFSSSLLVCFCWQPARQESCNLMSCGDFSNNDLDDNEHSGMTKWLVAFFVLLGLVAVGGLGFAGYTYYQRYD